MTVPHPIPYQGSKRLLAPRILELFPSAIERLVEPFAGSAAISLAAADRGLARRFWINDAHSPLAELWCEIIERPDELAANYQRIWDAQQGQPREHYQTVRAEFNTTHRPELFLFLLARCVKAAVRYNGAGHFNNSPDNRRQGTTPQRMRARILGAAELLRGRTEIGASDYVSVLERCLPTDLIYLDPPYQGVSGGKDPRYAPRIDREQFCEMLELLNRRACRYLVSYDGRTGEKTYGVPLPTDLNLTRIEVYAGRSSQATLLGKQSATYEALYISPALAAYVG